MAGEDSQLKVSVGTTYDNSGIDAANKAISGFTKTSETNLDNLAKSAKNSSNALSQGLAKAASATATSGKAIVKGSDQAAFALTNLGRVAQDAPFGFVGIQNNLNPLLESFQRLKAETGSNASAFKALTSQLIGPAGFGLALSLVGSAILFYQEYQRKANKETENAKKVTHDYVKSLDAVTGSQLKGAQNAQKELTDLKLLYSAYTNANEPLKARQSAYKQIQEQYPSYFGNIKFEKDATDKTKAAYDLLTESILASARARAASDKITQNETRKLENEQKVIDLQKAQIKNQSELSKARAREASQPLSGGSTAGVSTNVADLTRVSKIQDKINENLSLQNNLKTDTNLLDKENGRLVTYVNTQIEKGGKLNGGFGKSEKETKGIADVLKTLNNELSKIQSDQTLEGLANKTDKISEAYKKAKDAVIDLGYSQTSKEVIDLSNNQLLYSKSIDVVTEKLKKQNAVKLDGRLKSVDVGIDNGFEGFYKNLNGSKVEQDISKITDSIKLNEKALMDGKIGADEFIQRYQELFTDKKLLSGLKEFNELATQALGSGLSDAFSSIGKSLAEGTNAIDAFGSALLSAFAGFLSQLGQMFIKEGIAQIGYGIAKNLILPGSGANNIAGGLGMIGAGAAISIIGGAAGASRGGKGNYQSVKQVRGFASGVQGFGGGMAIVGERGPELLQLPQGSNVIPNPQTRQYMSEQNGVIINGNFDIGLEKLYLRLEQTGKRLNRKT